MEWYNYLACFFAGAFLANVVPHFVPGVMGNKFPTPFAKPRGKGLSSPTVNVVWALVNLAIGFVLLRAGHVNCTDWTTVLTFFAGVAVLSILMSIRFQKKEKE